MSVAFYRSPRHRARRPNVDGVLRSLGAPLRGRGVEKVAGYRVRLTTARSSSPIHRDQPGTVGIGKPNHSTALESSVVFTNLLLSLDVLPNFWVSVFSSRCRQCPSLSSRNKQGLNGDTPSPCAEARRLFLLVTEDLQGRSPKKPAEIVLKWWTRRVLPPGLAHRHIQDLCLQPSPRLCIRHA